MVCITTRKGNASSGFTLMEVLVSLLVLSIGLLGLAGLQMVGLRSVNDASTSTEAANLMHSVVERVRANPQATRNNAFANIDSTADIDCNTVPDPYCSSYHDGSDVVPAEECTAAEMATYDLNVLFCGDQGASGERIDGVQSAMPGATLTIVCTDVDGGTDPDPCTDGSTHTITIEWDQLPAVYPDADGDGTPEMSMDFLP